jgi:FixJ family two-component response regulator
LCGALRTPTVEHEGTTVTHQQHFIVIVDDDESVQEAATSLFRSMGFAARAFASPEHFLASEVRDLLSHQAVQRR